MPQLVSVYVDVGAAPRDTFTYALAAGKTVERGSLVVVELGSRVRAGIVKGAHSGKVPRNLKTIRTVISRAPIMPPYFMGLAAFSARRWFSSTSNALFSFLPSAIAGVRRPLPALGALPLRWAHKPAPLVVEGSRAERWEWYKTFLARQSATTRAAVLFPNKELAQEFARTLPRKDVVLWQLGGVRGVKENFVRVREGKFRIVVGTRSASFCPYPLELVICDDPHHLGYFSDRAPRINTVSFLMERTTVEGARVVIGTGFRGYGLRLWQRARAVRTVHLSKFPPVRIVEHKLKLFEFSTLETIKDALKRHLPVIVFHNRSGKSRWKVCLSCNECQPTMGVTCRNCGGGKFVAVGFDVHDLAEELKRQLGARVAVIAGAQSQFSPGAQVAVGTRALFEHVLPEHFVGILVDPDTAFLNPRFDSIEELLEDIGDLRGARELMIQTRHPAHRFFTQWGSWRGLITQELIERRALDLPPYGRLIEIRQRKGVAAAVAALGQEARLGGLGTRVGSKSIFIRGSDPAVREFIIARQLPYKPQWQVIPEPRTH